MIGGGGLGGDTVVGPIVSGAGWGVSACCVPYRPEMTVSVVPVVTGTLPLPCEAAGMLPSRIEPVPKVIVVAPPSTVTLSRPPPSSSSSWKPVGSCSDTGLFSTYE